MNKQEILSKIAFIKLMQKNYKGDGLDLTQGDIALVSNEKCYVLFKDIPDKFEKIDFKDIPIDALKYIYNNRNKLVQKDNGHLIYDTNLKSLLVENSLDLMEDSEIELTEKVDIPVDFDEEVAGMLFEKESEQLWRDTQSEKVELLTNNLTPMGNLPPRRHTAILELYKNLGKKLVKLGFDTDKVVLKKSNIRFDSKIRPFLIQRIRAVINQWSKTSIVIVQELLPNTKDVKAKNFLISLLKENTKNLISNFKRDLDIELRMSFPTSSIKYFIWGEVLIIGGIAGIGVGDIAGVGAGVGAFIGTIASIVGILAYLDIRP